jgi:hypothetical protein
MNTWSALNAFGNGKMEVLVRENIVGIRLAKINSPQKPVQDTVFAERHAHTFYFQGTTEIVESDAQ